MNSNNEHETAVSKRLATYLPDGIYDKLEEWANNERRSISNLAAFLLEQVVREHEKSGQIPPKDENEKDDERQ